MYPKIDFRNAFNLVRYDIILEEIRYHFPKIFHYVLASYGSISTLTYVKFLGAFQEEVQQSDPVGPLLFYIGF